MGLMDKVKQSAETALNKAQQGVNQGKAKIDQAQSKRQWDGLLHNLGAAIWAEQREGGPSTAVTSAWAALDEHLATNGPVEAGPGAGTGPVVAPLRRQLETPRRTVRRQAGLLGPTAPSAPTAPTAPPDPRAAVPERSPRRAPARLAVALLLTVLLATVLLVAALLATHRSGGAKTASVGGKAGRLAGTWALGAVLPAEGANELPAIFSCGSSTFCVAMDQGGAGAWVYQAGKWDFDGHAGPAGGFGTVTGLRCFADKTCTASDAEADVITYKDGTWSARSGPTANGGGPMGCASPTLCLFIDGVGQSYTWDGKAFSKPKVAYPSLANTMGSGAGYIACAAGSTFCAVADQLGYLGTYARGRWGPLARPFGLILPLGAGCVSPTSCVAPFRPGNGRPGNAPAGGDWAVWDGSHWGAEAGGTHGFPDADAEIGSTMSCAPGLCMGLDNEHGAGLAGYAYNGRSWSETAPFRKGAKAPSLLACANAKWCMALYLGQGTSPGTSWVFSALAG